MSEKNIRIAIQGQESSHSHNVSKRLYPHAEVKHCDSFIEAINALGKDEVDLVILPYGNQLAGVVRERIKRDWRPDNGNILSPKEGEIFVVQKFLNDLEKHNLVQIERYTQRIVHCLLGTNDSSLEDIQHVYSHEMAILQCGAYLDNKKIKKNVFHDTAGSAKHVAELNDKSVASIADFKAAETYGLKVLEAKIADIEPNFTDFVSFTKAEKEDLFLK